MLFMPFDLSRLSLLVADADPGAKSRWLDLARSLTLSPPVLAGTVAQAWARLGERRADVLICRFELPDGDGANLVRRLRTDPQSPNPFLPAILVPAALTRDQLKAAVDAGVHEMMALPITPKSLEMRLRQVVEKPRTFVKGEGYFGPDRRRQARADFAGPFRRASDRRS